MVLIIYLLIKLHSEGLWAFWSLESTRELEFVACQEVPKNCSKDSRGNGF